MEACGIAASRPQLVIGASVDEVQYVPDVEVGVSCDGSSIPVARDDHYLGVVESLLCHVGDSGVPELVKPDTAIKSSLYACQTHSLGYRVRSDSEKHAVWIAFYSGP